MLSSRRFRLMLLGAVSSTAFTTAHAADIVLPSIGTITSVSSNTVTAVQSGAQTTITQTTPRAIVKWSDLSVPSGNLLEFVQPSASSVTLNKVVRATDGPAIVPTNINGELKA
ncbi:MAG: hemagglutination domain, partial [Pseudomonadota bacterium]